MLDRQLLAVELTAMHLSALPRHDMTMGLLASHLQLVPGDVSVEILIEHSKSRVRVFWGSEEPCNIILGQEIESRLGE